LKGVYAEDQYRKQQEFERVKYKFSLISGLFSFAVLMSVLLSGGFSFLDLYIRQFTNHPIGMALLFFGIIGFLSDLLSMPFEVYDTFRIEQQFGFNTTSVRTYVVDKLKSWLLAAVFGGLILSLIVYFYTEIGEWFLLLAFSLVTAFSIFVNYFYTTLFVPLFNKLTPLEEGVLKNEIEKYCLSVNFRIHSILVIDGSKRSKRANAYFSGFGHNKKVVFYDTLLSDHSNDEIIAILAHEIGHYRKKHVVKGLILGMLQTAFLFWVLSVFLSTPFLSGALGSQPGFHMGLLSFVLLFSPFSALIGILVNYVSRRHEYQADYFASVTFKAQSLANALKRLSANNLSNLTPHPLYVFFRYSHPTLLQRLEAISNVKQEELPN
jgi:STE24 endopeptidase